MSSIPISYGFIIAATQTKTEGSTTQGSNSKIPDVAKGIIPHNHSYSKIIPLIETKYKLVSLKEECETFQ